MIMEKLTQEQKAKRFDEALAMTTEHHWKPTASQITVLQKAANDNTLSCEELNILSELYEQLKKL